MTTIPAQITSADPGELFEIRNVANVVPPADAADDAVGAAIEYGVGHLGIIDPDVTRSLPLFEHVNLQTALDAWAAEEGREVSVQGLMLPPHYGGVTLQQLVSGGGSSALRLSAPPLVDLEERMRPDLQTLAQVMANLSTTWTVNVVAAMAPAPVNARSASRTTY